MPMSFVSTGQICVSASLAPTRTAISSIIPNYVLGRWQLALSNGGSPRGLPLEHPLPWAYMCPEPEPSRGQTAHLGLASCSFACAACASCAERTKYLQYPSDRSNHGLPRPHNTPSFWTKPMDRNVRCGHFPWPQWHTQNTPKPF